MTPDQLLEVVTPAASQALVDLSTLKSDLGVTGSGSDARLTRIIDATAARVAAYVGRPLVEQEYRETFRLPPRSAETLIATLPRDPIGVLPLSRMPVTTIVSVIEAGVTLDPTLYEWVDGVGLRRLASTGGTASWAAGVIAVRYKAGWIGAKGTTTGSQVALPADLYEAALEAARADYLARDRDPGVAVRSESFSGVYDVSYDTRSPIDTASTYGLPPRVMSILDNYRRATFAW